MSGHTRGRPSGSTKKHPGGGTLQQWESFWRLLLALVSALLVLYTIAGVTDERDRATIEATVPLSDDEMSDLAPALAGRSFGSALDKAAGAVIVNSGDWLLIAIVGLLYGVRVAPFLQRRWERDRQAAQERASKRQQHGQATQARHVKASMPEAQIVDEMPGQNGASAFVPFDAADIPPAYR